MIKAVTATLNVLSGNEESKQLLKTIASPYREVAAVQKAAKTPTQVRHQAAPRFNAKY